MLYQADVSGSNAEPPIKFREISWVAPVIVPGPVRPYFDIDGDGDGPVDVLEGRDTPVSSSSGPLIRIDRGPLGEAISEGRVRDSLELKKYQPPNPLGVRRASQASAFDAAAAAAAPAQGPAMTSEVFTFSVPSTMLPGDQARRRGLAPYALNVVQPYPNPTGLVTKKRAAPVDLGLPFPERLLKRQAREISVSHAPDGSAMVMKALGEELHEELKAGGAAGAGEEPGEGAAARRFSLIEGLALRVRKDKDKPKSEAVPPAQEAAGGDANPPQQPQEQPQQQEQKQKQGFLAIFQGKDRIAALESIQVGESARGKDRLLAGEPVLPAPPAPEVRDGKKRYKIRRRVRKTVGRYMTVSRG